MGRGRPRLDPPPPTKKRHRPSTDKELKPDPEKEIGAKVHEEPSARGEKRRDSEEGEITTSSGEQSDQSERSARTVTKEGRKRNPPQRSTLLPLHRVALRQEVIIDCRGALVDLPSNLRRVVHELPLMNSPTKANPQCQPHRPVYRRY
ncbi:hypothetical protein QR680_016300 [Steinernema hermaphroditum]|uniref:Uncharacterized protein n=1 Tax=Steinernema hermaphroditum TaxID=289476 RepID=A0AA39HCX3_9BILA|nr:hypothetical protein QR680_016300 [Steinernema hermaphroditum]